MFSVSNASVSYQFPMQPSSSTYTPKPLYQETQTLAGRNIQLLGYQASGHLTGWSPVANSTSGLWGGESLFLQTWARILEQQRDGSPSHLEWTEQNLSVDCALGDIHVTENAGQQLYEWEFDWQLIKPSPITRTNAGDLYAMVAQEIGFTPDTKWESDSTRKTTLTRIPGFPGLPDSMDSVGTNSGSTGTVTTTSGGFSIQAAQKYAQSLLPEYGLDPSQFSQLVSLWNRESSWNPHAENPGSGAYGIGQILGSHTNYGKVAGEPSVITQSSPWYRNSWQNQINWALGYIKNRYGSISNAWAHELEYHWY